MSITSENRSLGDLAEPREDVAASYTEKFRTIRDAFDADKAVHLTTDGEREGRYLYRDENGNYRIAFHEKRWRYYRFTTFGSELQLWSAMSDEIEVLPVEETRLYHGTYGLREPRHTFTR